MHPFDSGTPTSTYPDQYQVQAPGHPPRGHGTVMAIAEALATMPVGRPGGPVGMAPFFAARWPGQGEGAVVLKCIVYLTVHLGPESKL